MSTKKLLSAFILTIASVGLVFSSHNASRYFPFLEKPEEYVTKKKSYVYPAFFITAASTAFRRAGGNTGIPELWGKYDLKDVISSVEAVKLSQGASHYNPFEAEVGYADWNKKEIKFFIDGKVKSRGIILNAEQNLFKSDFSIGFCLPLMHVNTSLRFMFDSEHSHADVKNVTQQEKDMLDRVRRSVHKDLCLKGADWEKGGIGDLDVHVRWRHFWDHTAKMKSIDLNIQTGLVCPTGEKADKYFASSVPFMGNGHWTWYGDVISEFELKQNWKLGILAGIMNQWKKIHDMRIPYYKEPAIFSALQGNVEIDPGITGKISPYFTLENMMDGLHFQLRYTYLRHSPDTWTDKRKEKIVPSYLSIDKEDIASVRHQKKDLSKWTSHYLTMQLEYDSVEAMKHWTWKPKLYVVYDYPLGGRGICKTHQLTVGAELHFW